MGETGSDRESGTDRSPGALSQVTEEYGAGGGGPAPTIRYMHSASDGPAFTYHLVTRLAWQATDPTRPYEHSTLATEGVIHCTDGEDELALTANRYFREEADELLVLLLHRASISAPTRYDDPRRVFTHVYGPLNRNAIRAVFPLQRGADGAFLPPEPPAGSRP